MDVKELSNLITKHSADRGRSFTSLDTLSDVVSLLDKRQKAYSLPDYVIAGGCIRDIVLGLNVKDIDVFVDSGTDPLGLAVLYAGSSEAATQKPGDQSYARIEGADNQGFEVYDVYNFLGQEVFCPPLQIICKEFNSVDDLLGSFDYNAVMAGYSPSTGVVFKKAFLDSLETRKVDKNTARTRAFCTKSGWSLPGITQRFKTSMAPPPAKPILKGTEQSPVYQRVNNYIVHDEVRMTAADLQAWIDMNMLRLGWGQDRRGAQTEVFDDF